MLSRRLVSLVLMAFIVAVFVSCGQRAIVDGTAEDAVLGAVILKDSGELVFIDGLAEWPSEVFGRRVRAKGILKERKPAPDPVVDEGGAVGHGMLGTAAVLEDVEWRVMD